MHIMILALPIIALAAWALFGEAYHPVAVIFLMTLFYLLPTKLYEENVQSKQ